MAMKVAINELGNDNINIVHVSLPANKNTIIDKMDKAKIFGETSLRIVNCYDFPELNGFEFTEEPMLDELNFLAKRLDEISDDSMKICAYRALLHEPMDTIKEAINQTYNLETVSVYCCKNLRQYGEMIMDDGLLDELENVSDKVFIAIHKNSQTLDKGGII